MRARDPSLFDMLMIGLATFRLSRLAAEDDFPPVQWTRERLRKRLGSEHPIMRAIECPWCSSPWIASVLVPLSLRYEWIRKTLMIPAASALTGLLSTADGAMGRVRQSDSLSWHIESGEDDEAT